MRDAGVQGAEAARDASVARYRQTVLTAFQAVEDRLSATRARAEQASLRRAASISLIQAPGGAGTSRPLEGAEVSGQRSRDRKRLGRVDDEHDQRVFATIIGVLGSRAGRCDRRRMLPRELLKSDGRPHPFPKRNTGSG